MSAVIKGLNVVYTGNTDINNQIKVPVRTVEPKEQIEQLLSEADNEHIDRENLEKLRDSYINEGKRIAKELTERANEEASRITERSTSELMTARREAETIRKNAVEETKEHQEKARRDGYNEGFKKGTDDGYIQGLKKCKETLLELKKINQELLDEKDSLIQQYEHQMFDMIFAVAQKITVDSLKQRDRAIIEKMLKEAAKQFRKAKTVKVTLSSLDLSENIDADIENLRGIFNPSTYVEFDVQKDAESGTLIVDSGSEIVDASVSTQLRMIEELGRGKYRDVKATIKESPADDEEEKPEEEKTFSEVLGEKVGEPPSLTLLSGYEEDRDRKIHVEKEDDDEYTISDDDSFDENSEPETASSEKVSQEETAKMQKSGQNGGAAAEEAAEKKTSSKRPRKPTNPLLTKMMDNLGGKE